MYKLQLTNETLQLPPNLEQLVSSPTVDGVYRLQFSSRLLICVRYGSFLIGFEYEEASGTWKHLWEERIVERRLAAYDSSKYPLLLTNLTNPSGGSEEVLILRHETGIRFFRFEASSHHAPPRLVLLSEDPTFGDASNWDNISATFLWGRIFPDPNILGLLTRNYGHVKFYAVKTARVFQKERYPMAPFDLQTSLDPAWSSSETEFLILGIQSEGGDVIGLRTAEALLLYQFNAQYQLIQLESVPSLLPLPPNLLRPAILFTQRLTSSDEARKDVLECDASKISIFSYDPRSSVYEQQYEQRYDGGTRRAMNCKSLQTIDLNEDDIEEVVLRTERGLELLSFNTSTNSWTSVLHTDNLRGQERFLDVVGALPLPSTATLFTFNSESNSLRTARLLPHFAPRTSTVAATLSTTPAPPPPARSSAVPEQIPRAEVKTRRVLRWTEKWDDSFLEKTVSAEGGKVQFEIPLVDVVTEQELGLRMSLSYDRQLQERDGPVGLGWGLPLTVDRITVDHRRSIFEDDAVYTLHSGGKASALERISDTGTKVMFQIPEQPDVSVAYHKPLTTGDTSKMNQGKWVLDSERERTVYGNSREAIQSGLRWPNWAGSGRDWATLEPVPLAWHLTEHHAKKRNASLRYTYQQEERRVPRGKSYTTALRLAKISDDGGRNTLEFEYGTKHSSEYTLPPTTDDKGNIQLGSVGTTYLRALTLLTPSHTQRLQFDYRVNDGKRYLTQISQLIHGHVEQLLQFGYEPQGESSLLKSIESPRGLSIQYTYTDTPVLQCPPAHPALQRHPVAVTPTITLSPASDYVVLAHKRPGQATASQIVVQVLDQSSGVTKSVLVLDTLTEEGVVSGRGVEYFTVTTFQNFFSVTMTTKTEILLVLFHRIDGIWSPTPKYCKYHLTTRIRHTGSTFFISQSQPDDRLSTLELELGAKGEAGEWVERTISSDSVSRIATDPQNPNRIFTYDNTSLFMFSRPNSNSPWTRKLLDDSLAEINEDGTFPGLLNLSPSVRKRVQDDLREDALQVMNNAVLLSTVQIKNGRVEIVIRLLVLGRRGSVLQRQSYRIPREVLSELRQVVSVGNGEFTLHYVTGADGIHRVEIKAITGKPVEDILKIRNDNLRKDAMRKRLEHLNKDEDTKNNLKEVVLFNWSTLYRIRLSPQGIQCGNDTLIRMSGSVWTREALVTPASTNSLPLGEHFQMDHVKREGRGGFEITLYALKPTKRPVKRIQIPSLDKIINRFPMYLAWEESRNRTDVVALLPFVNGNEIGREVEWVNEKLHPASNYQNFFTVANNTLQAHSYPMELLSRPLWSLLPPPTEPLVQKIELRSEGVTRTTGYQRSFKYHRQNADDLCTQSIEIVPGGRRNVSGWEELSQTHHYISTGTSKNVTSHQRWFDATGAAVLVPDTAQKQGERKTDMAEEDEDADWTLKDQSGQLRISNFYPYTAGEQEVGYIGFEAYEKTGEDNENFPWQFRPQNVIQSGFSFTGAHFLRLTSTRKGKAGLFRGIFKPSNQEATYVVTSWIRSFPTNQTSSPTQLRLGAQVPFFRAIIRSEVTEEEIVGLEAVVQRQEGDWSYVEILVNFPMLQQIHVRKQLFTTNTFRTGRHMRLMVEILASDIELDERVTLDIDHVRFSPLDLDFQATVFDQLTGQTTATVESDGAVTRTFYFRDGGAEPVQIANTKEDGRIERLVRVNKVGNLFRVQSGVPNQPPSTLTIQPRSGSFENFDPSSLRTRWRVGDGEEGAWKIAPGQLWHASNSSHSIHAHPSLFTPDSCAVRGILALHKINSAIELDWETLYMKYTREREEFGSLAIAARSQLGNTSAPHLQITGLPNLAEFIVGVEGSDLFVWVDGVLVVDQELPHQKSSPTPCASFSMEVKGSALIQDLFILNEPQIKVEYLNGWGDASQTVTLEGANSAVVTQVVYDEIGRGAIRTKLTRLHRSANETLLGYHRSFVLGGNPSDAGSVWTTGHLRGEVDRLNPTDAGFAYFRTQFESSPLNLESVSGLPGADFSVTGRYSKRLGRESGIAFVNNKFPQERGYWQKTVRNPWGSLEVSVYDWKKNRVATYSHTPGFDHLLTTYEYDSLNRPIKTLPPMYHQKANTLSNTWPWEDREIHLSPQEKALQVALGTHTTYDAKGLVTSKTTPDGGRVNYFYDSNNLVRFMQFQGYGSHNSTDTVNFMEYDPKQRLSRTGLLTTPISAAQLAEAAAASDAQVWMNATGPLDSQKIYYSDEDADPKLRGRLKQFITQSDGNRVVEQLEFNSDILMVAKKTLTPAAVRDTQAPFLSAIKKVFHGDRLLYIKYPDSRDGDPLEPFQLYHTYNRRGDLIGLGIPGSRTRYAKFSYNADGHISSETHAPHSAHNLTRTLTYNSSGFLEKIADPFLTQELSYTTGGYGEDGHGDGSVMRSTFRPTWMENADPQEFKLLDDALANYEFSRLCIEALKRQGYLSASGQPLKQLTPPAARVNLPRVCGGKKLEQLAQLAAAKERPTVYGHTYSYGNHKELIRAKYFTQESTQSLKPLQPDAFSNIPGLNLQLSQDVWEKLTRSDLVSVTQGLNTLSQTGQVVKPPFGKPGPKPLFNEAKLSSSLNSLSSDYAVFARPIQQLLLAKFCEREILTETKFQEALLDWEGGRHWLTSHQPLLSTQKKTAARQIFQKLSADGLVSHSTPTNDNLYQGLDRHFRETLRNYTTVLPEIVGVLQSHFSQDLGTHPFDLESYDIDANGNHRMFYSGYNRYQLHYTNNTNQIHFLQLTSPDAADRSFEVAHDPRGNVVKAMHRGIQQITYDPVSQRATRIALVDGRSIRLLYDSQGERIVKQVFDAAGDIRKEILYVRDEQSRVLMDTETTFLQNSEPLRMNTLYIYGPRGLLAFIRNRSFHSVLTDHSGSVRLVVRGGEVVASYDYMPYGELMRSYCASETAHIRYRYTGQEWDEETGLYNFHARLYDPAIGRFYGLDPKSQYPSPYKYAGNSPVSLVDPDGEFAFMLAACVIGALAGAYLGGAKANNRWNPLKWDWRLNKGTYLGMFGGAVGGALLPIGFAASVAALGGGALAYLGTVGLGVGGAYLTGAAGSGNWKFQEWDWDRPAVYDSLFQGFGTGTGLVGGVKAPLHFGAKVFKNTKNGLYAYVTLSVVFGGGVAYASAVIANEGKGYFWEWNWTNPATYSALVNGFDSGFGMPQGFTELGRGLGKLGKNPKNLISAVSKIGKEGEKIGAIVRMAKHPMFKIVSGGVMAYMMGSGANDNMDLTQWHWDSFSTYEGILNGVFFGKDVHSMLAYKKDADAVRALKRLAAEGESGKGRKMPWMEALQSAAHALMASKQGGKLMDIMKVLFREGVRSPFFGSVRTEGGAVAVRDSMDFLQRGYDAWVAGDNEPPAVLKGLIAERVKSERSSKKPELERWAKEGGGGSEREKWTCRSDRELPFLTSTCGGKRRRRKRCVKQAPEGLDDSLVNEASTITAGARKRELGDKFLDKFVPSGIMQEDGFELINPVFASSEVPRSFPQQLAEFLVKTTNFLSTTKQIFFPHVFLGSILTISQSVKSKHSVEEVWVKMEKVEYNLTYKKGKSGPPSASADVLKVFLKVKAADGGSEILCRTVASEPRLGGMDVNQDATRSEMIPKLKDAGDLSAENLKEIAGVVGDEKGNVRISGTTYYLDHQLSLIVRDTRGKARAREAQPVDLTEALAQSFADDRPPQFTFKKIALPQDQKLELSMNKIVTNEINEVKAGAEEMVSQLLEIYQANAHILDLNTGIEAGFHGFLYGFLEFNCKAQYGLDVTVERIAGRGYADLTFIARGTASQGLHLAAIPVVVELKADGRTSSSGANAQTKGTGYLYNLSLRTVATEAILVGVDSKLSNAKKAKPVEAQQVPVPQPKGFFTELFGPDSTPSKNDVTKDGIERELKHLYYSISPQAFTKGSSGTYLSRMLVGMVMGKKLGQSYLLAPFQDTRPPVNPGNASPPKATLPCTTLLLKAPHRDHYMLLNLVESASAVTLPPTADIPLPAEVVGTLTRVDVHVNAASKEGWSIDNPKRESGSARGAEDFFFQSAKIEQYTIPISAERANKVVSFSDHAVSMDMFFGTIGAAESQRGALKEVSQALEPLRHLVNRESDFQAILHGMFQGMESKPGAGEVIRVFPEANPSSDGRMDLAVVQLTKNGRTVNEKNILVLELKYSKSEKKKDLHKELEKAADQARKYEHNLKSMTNLGKVTYMAAVYNSKSAGDIILYTVDEPADILHTSVTNTRRSSQVDLAPVRRASQDGSPSTYILTMDLENLHVNDVEPSREKRPESWDGLSEEWDIKRRKGRSVRTNELDAGLRNGSNLDFLCPLEKPNKLSLTPTPPVSSGADSLRFWPVQFIRSLGKGVIGGITSHFFGNPLETEMKQIRNWPHPFLTGGIHGRSSTGWKSPHTEQSILDIGDAYCGNVEGSSQLLLLHVLHKTLGKYFGGGGRTGSARRCRVGSDAVGSAAEVSIRVWDVTVLLVEALEVRAREVGLNARQSRRIIEELYLSKGLKYAVQKCVAEGGLEELPLIWVGLVQVYLKETGNCLGEGGDAALVEDLRRDIPRLQKELLSLERKWFTS